jgi:iron complex transport system substrate-binding protein
VDYDDGSSEEVTEDVEWSVSDSSLASIQNGVFTGDLIGEVEISAVYDEEQATTTVTIIKKTITIVDGLKRTVEVKIPVESVCYVHPNMAEAIKILDGWGLVVGKSYWAVEDYIYPNLDELPVIDIPDSMSNELNYEQILELMPDVMIMFDATGIYGPNFADVIIESLEPEIPVVILDSVTNDLDTREHTFMTLGKILEKEQRADEYLEWYTGVYNTIIEKTSQIPEDERVSVFYKISGYTPEQLMTFNNNSAWARGFFEITNTINVANDLPSITGYVLPDPEWVAEQNYDVIWLDAWDAYYPNVFGPVGNLADAEAIAESIKKDPLFMNSDAVKNDRIYISDQSYFSMPRNIIGLAYKAKACYPELFADFDVEKIHEEYMIGFLDVDMNMEEAAFFYPSL